MGWNPVGELKKLFSKAKDEISSGLNKVKNEVGSGINRVKWYAEKGKNEVNSLASKGKKEVTDLANKGKREVNDLTNKGVREVTDLAKTATDEIKDAADKAKEGVEQAVETCLQTMLSEISKGALNKAVDIIQVAVPDSVGLKIGPVSLDISDVNSRIDTLQRWASHPPTSKEDIKEMIVTLAPTSVGVEFDVQLALLVVSSDALEMGISLSWETQSFLDKFESIMSRF